MSRRRRSRKNAFTAGSAARLASPLLALLLLPVAAAVWAAAADTLRSLSLPWRAFLPVLGGAGAYGLLHAFLPRPMGLYVFGHELTHALAAWLSGYRVKSMKVSPAGGEVVTSDTNLFVALAPYCVPLYTLLVLLAYAVVRRYAHFTFPPLWCGAGVGFTFAFHAALTLHALRQNQPDLRHGGTFLSLVLIGISNGLVAALLLKALFPEAVSLRLFGVRFWELARAGAERAAALISLAAARGRFLP